MKKLVVLCSIFLFCFVGFANAELIVRGTDTLGNKLIYDTDLNITWYDYSNSHDTWANQVAWADGLSISYAGDTLDDWRLPSTEIQANGYNQTGSEMGHLYYEELGFLSYYDRGSVWVTTAELNASEFDNLIADYWYWSGTIKAAYPDHAWSFIMANGLQTGGVVDGDRLNGLAVRSGDVSVVPIPGGICLLGTGLIGLASLGRRKQGNRR